MDRTGKLTKVENCPMTIEGTWKNGLMEGEMRIDTDEGTMYFEIFSYLFTFFISCLFIFFISYLFTFLWAMSLHFHQLFVYIFISSFFIFSSATCLQIFISYLFTFSSAICLHFHQLCVYIFNQLFVYTASRWMDWGLL